MRALLAFTMLLPLLCHCGSSDSGDGTEGDGTAGSAGSAAGAAGSGGSAAGAGGGTAGKAGSTGSFTALCGASSASTCTCAAPGTAPPAIACTPKTVGGGVCCANFTYPNGGTCQCNAFSCQDDGGFCSCSGIHGSTGTTECPATYKSCCKNEALGTCTCYDGIKCNSSEVSVTSCSMKNSGCSDTYVRIDACTP